MNGRRRANGVIGSERTLAGMGGVQAPVLEDAHCTVQGCYREAVSIGGYCPTHKKRMVRTGMTDTATVTDWVMDDAGPTCGVCGRSVYRHGVTEFCQQVARVA